MAAVTWPLGSTTLVDWLTLGTALVATALVFRFQMNSA